MFLVFPYLISTSELPLHKPRDTTISQVGKAVTKAIPIFSGFLSGGLSIVTYLPMAKKLQRDLSRLVAMSPEDLAEASIEADIILEEYTVLSEDDTESDGSIIE